MAAHWHGRLCIIALKQGRLCVLHVSIVHATPSLYHRDMKETRTGVAKGTFWAFYCAAQATAYTTSNIKSAWRGTGIVPFNPDAVLTKLPGYKHPGRAPRVPKVPTTPRSFKLLQTPMNRRELRQQTLSAIEYLGADPTLSGATKESSITLLCRLAHQSE